MNTQSNYSKTVSPAASRTIAEAIAPVLPAAPFAEIIEQVAKKFIASLNDSALLAFNGRLERGLELAKNGNVSTMADPIHPRRYSVRSSDALKSYIVDLDDKTCDCPDSNKGHTCKHRVAAYYFEQAGKLKGNAKPAVTQPRHSAPVQPAKSVEEKAAPSTLSTPTLSTPAAIPQKVQTAPSAPQQTATKTEEQLLKELGFAPQPQKAPEPKQVEPQKPVQQAPQPPKPEPQKPEPKKPEPQTIKERGYTLGSLYRRYLRGSDLAGEVITVTILDVTKEKVLPHPSQPAIEKWCLTISGLPATLPARILFGAQGEADLVAIFGPVSIESIKGKQIVVYPKATYVAGQQKISIRFRGAK